MMTHAAITDLANQARPPLRMRPLCHDGRDRPIDFRASALHNARVSSLLTFLGFGVATWALWRLLNRQESADPEFQRRLQADDRRARANRQAAARGAAPPADDSIEPPAAS